MLASLITKTRYIKEDMYVKRYKSLNLSRD